MFQEINLQNLNVVEMQSLCRAFNLPYRLRRAQLEQQLHRVLRNEIPIVEAAAEVAVDNQLRNNNNQANSFLSRVFGT